MLTVMISVGHADSYVFSCSGALCSLTCGSSSAFAPLITADISWGIVTSNHLALRQASYWVIHHSAVQQTCSSKMCMCHPRAAKALQQGSL